MLNRKDQELLERLVAQAPWLLDVLDDTPEQEQPQPQPQAGGAVPSLGSAKGSLIQTTQALPPLTGDDVSLDLMFQKFLDKTEEIDKFWDEFAYQSPGIAKKLNSDLIVTIPPIPPYLPISTQVPIPKKPLALFLIALIDSIRLSSALAGYPSTALTVLVFVEEIITGQWRQALLTSAGFLSPSGVAFGVLGKYSINAWTLISPDLRSRILLDMFQGSKSLLIGFLVWSANTVVPQKLKEPVARSLKMATDKVGEFEDKVKTLEAQASAKLKPLGYRVQFPGLNFSPIKEITMEDLQNLQALARWDKFFCTAEFQDLVKPLLNEPITRLLIELIGVPTTPQDKFALCKRDEPYQSMGDVLLDAAEPQLVAEEGPALSLPAVDIPAVDLPSMSAPQTLPLKKGGSYRKSRKSRKTRKTRKSQKTLSSRLNGHTSKLVQKD